MSLILFPHLWSERRHWATGGWGPGRITCSPNTPGQTQSRLAAKVWSTMESTWGASQGQCSTPPAGVQCRPWFPGARPSHAGQALL